MSQGNVRPSTLGLAGIYLFLFILFMWPVVDLFSNTWPLQPGNIQWRIGFMGLLTAYLHTPLLALAMALVLSFALYHRLTLRLLSVLCVLGAVVLFLGMGFFALDAVQIRGGLAQESRGSFSAGTILSELKFFSVAVVLILLGWGGWRTGGRLPGKAKADGTSKLTAEVLKAQKRD